MSGFVVRDLGTLTYLESVEVQKEILEGVVNGSGSETLLLTEHPAVLTLGANYHSQNLLHPEDWYKSKNIEFQQSERGGDITFHSPGQLIAYPIFSLQNRGRDLHRWLRELEETIIEVLFDLGVAGRRFPPHTGVWVGDLKICAMGIKVRKWVSMHGLALNCSNDLEPFSWIVPCGIQDYGVTSLSKQLDRVIDPSEVKPILIERFAARFN